MILFSAIASAVSALLSMFWQAILVFVKAAGEKIKQVLMGAAVDAVNVFIRKSVDGLKNVSYNYIKQGGHYLEKIVTQKLDSSAQLPSDIQARVKNVSYDQEVDITDDFARELQLD